MSRISIDTSEVRALAADLRGVGAFVSAKVPGVVSKGALNIKNQMRAEASESTHFRFAHTISYDLEERGYAAVIGPEKGGAGSLANIAYFGGANGGGGTVPDPLGALEAEIPNFSDAIAKLIEGAL